MKTRIRNLRFIAALAVGFAVPWLASAATKEFTLTMSPTSQTVSQGAAGSTAFTEVVKNTGSFFGVTTLTVISNSGAGFGVSAGISPSAVNFTVNGTTTNTTLTVLNTAGTPAGSYTITIWGNTTNAVGSGVDPNKTNTATLIVSAGGAMTWTPPGANTNWSSGGNWSPGGPPAANSDVKFYDTGAVPSAGTINNVVDTSFTIPSLSYGQTNNSHTTLIAPGITLAIASANPVDPLSAGTGTDLGPGQVTVTTIKGTGGTLTVSDTGANLNVGQAAVVASPGFSSAQATLDLSGLDTFTASVARVYVGSDASAPLKAGSSGILNLAKTNRITTASADPTRPQIDIGDNTQANGTEAVASSLVLGQTNAIFADSIAVGRGKGRPGGSTMLFNSSFATPVAYFRGVSGASSRVSSWAIGDANSGRASVCFGIADFSLGTVNALVDTMFVGEGSQASPGTSPGTGTLTLSVGTIDVNTLEVGYNGTYTSGSSTVVNTGTGTVNVNGGALVVNTTLELAHGDFTAAGTLNVNSGTVTANAGITAGGGSSTITLINGTLNVANSAATIGTALSPVSALSLHNSTLKVAAQSLAPAVSVTTLSADGTANPLNISAVPLITAFPAQFTLIQYASSGGDLSTLTLGTLPAGSPAYAGFISNNTANSSIDLVLTSGPIFYPLLWVGVPNGWDINSTQNWKSNGIAVQYLQNYQLVQFDDSGASTVNLTTTLTPGSVVVNNSTEDYTFSGAGKLSGGTSLTKSGSQTLTFAETGGNDFTNGVTVTGGTLQVGNGGTAGSLGAGSVSLAGGTALVFNRSDDITAPNVISGTGTLTKSAADSLTLGGTNSSFVGAIAVAQGTLRAGNASALGTAAATVAVSAGATLDVNGQAFNNLQGVTALGAGVGGNGAIVNNATNNATKVFRNLTLTGDTTLGGASDWDIHASGNGASDALLSGTTPYKLTKKGTNTVTVFGAQVDSNLGDVDLLAGTVSFERNTTSMGDPSKTVTVFTNATLQFGNASNIWTKTVVLKDGGTLRAVSGAEFAGPVSLESGTGTLLAGTGGQLTLDAAVTGAGGLAKTGAGNVSLLGANTYPGNTLVSAGTLALGASASIDNSSNITIAAGATLDVSAHPDQKLTLTSGQSLKGSGTVIGHVTVVNNSALAPGGPGVNVAGALTITSNLVLQAGSTTLMDLNMAAGTNDQARGMLSVSYGGTLTVSGLGGAYAPNNVFKLFDAASYIPSSFTTMNLPLGVVWDTTKLGVDGTIKVVSVAPPQLTSFAPGGGGSFQLNFSAAAGEGYRVWASTNAAATPVSSTWTLLTNLVFGTSGTATFVDTSATNYPARFYVISVP